MIQIITDNSTRLLEALRDAVQSAHIQEWIIDDQGDFTYANAPWKNLAWMRVRKTTNGLRVNIVGNKEFPVDDETYAVYHSRFVEMLVLYFDESFDTVEVTALGTESDLI